MPSKELVNVEAEDASAAFGPAKVVALLREIPATRGGKDRVRVDTLYARTGPYEMYAGADGEALCSNVWVHVLVEFSDGVGDHAWRPSVSVNRPGSRSKRKFDWLGRRRCDLVFDASASRFYLHRIAAFVWGNPARVTWADFNATAPNGTHNLEADHKFGDDYDVDAEKCEVVTREENRLRQEHREELKRTRHDPGRWLDLDAEYRELFLQTIDLDFDFGDSDSDFAENLAGDGSSGSAEEGGYPCGCMRRRQ